MMKNRTKGFNEKSELNISDVRSRLFAVMADDYIILKLFWKKEDAEKELGVYKNEHKEGMFFVDEVEVY
jgi:hypothetical protein